ncbi:phosphonate ABC transporter, permease protein PhnE [Xanthobacter oligotrophicus]|uniref:phosphonate ABC transporter, permease protein PhnE n=1 Tax=Xanthobacter oligotrophicus TaxID=2607286 RepID=UPI0011F0AF3A|nr:phosphonate ABC transporter, permease protein PhnE [Xanthobacter oligotrophicus]MCG5236883.1 phosphonate ABC transporter, permease protein PhnE [Xanthobacter oligotrophicus]
MAHAVTRLPDAQLAPMLAAYEAAVRERRRHSFIAVAVVAVCIVLAAWMGEVKPGVLFANAGRLTTYFASIIPTLRWDTLGADLAEWYWNLDHWLKLLLDTILIAYLGTLIGGIGAFFLCFLACANLVRSPLIRLAARRYLEFCRTVPELVFALLFVVAFGLGPMPGVLALAIHTMGALGKLFAEVVENIDMKPVEGAVAAGASWPKMVRFAVVPQVTSNFASYGLLRFEINVREASIMGFVGAGGIGQDLVEAIRKFYYSDVSAILLLIIAAVMIIDLVTEQIRHRLLGVGGGR